MTYHHLRVIAAVSCLTAGVFAAPASSGGLRIATLSTDASRVTGGDVLVEITIPPAASPSSLKVLANGRDATHAFRASSTRGVQVGLGLLRDLAIGKNIVTAD